MYCEKCKHCFEGERCPNCRKGRVRQVRPDDPCYLTEQSSPWNGMLEDVLRQEGIPCVTSGRLGAGLSTYVGSVLEITRFYVRWSDMEKARESVNGLFGKGCPDTSNERGTEND